MKSNDVAAIATSRTSGDTWRHEDGAALVLNLHVQPGASRTEAAGLHGGALKLRVASPPVDGKANATLLAWLADVFAVPLRAVTLVRGETSRQKTVRIESPRRRPDRDWGPGGAS